MSLNFGNSKVTQVKFGANTSNLSDVNKIVFNGQTAWCRPFTLTITKDSGVSSVTVTRTSTEEPTAKKNVTLSSGAEIYYNDVLSISASAYEDYYLDDYDSNQTVTGNTLIDITSTFQRMPVTPTIVSIATEGSTTSRIATFTIKNNNLFSSTISIVIEDSSGKTLIQEDIAVAFEAGESRYLVRQLPNGSYSIRIKAQSKYKSYVSKWTNYVTATYTVPTLSSPSLSVSGTTVTIKNNNSVAVTLKSLRPYSNTWATSTLAAGASTTRNCEQDLGMAGQTSGTFQAYFTCDGYTQSSTSSITVKKTQTTQDPLVYIKTFVPSITYSASKGITITNFSTLLSATGTTADYWNIYILRFHQRQSRRINDSARGAYRLTFGTRKFRMDKYAGIKKANSSGVVANTSSTYASAWVHQNCDDKITYGSSFRYNNCFGVRIMPASKTPYDQCFSKYSDVMYYSTSGGYYITDDIIRSITENSNW